MRIWLAAVPLVAALAQPPMFVADRVLPSGGSRPAKLAPGMFVSIYGDHLGPEAPCTGNADTQRKETPSPARPRQSFAETLIFPTELCGVQVFLAGRPAGLQYAGDKQINFKVPQEIAVDGEVELKVVYGGQSHAVRLRVGLENVALSLDPPAHAGGPVWLRIDPPFGWYDSVRYPVQVEAWNFGCQEIEVRRGGQTLPRIPVRLTGGMVNGNPCGTIGVGSHPATHTGRLPLHLQYRFDLPGVYEVRYTSREFLHREIVLQSEWTRITVLPAEARPATVGTMPADPADVLSDWLPSLLGGTDIMAMNAVIQCLYHPEPVVRRFAVLALGYWPEAEARRRLTEAYLARGPSDVVVDGGIAAQPDLLVRAAPYLQSNDRVLLGGAVIAATRLVYKQPSPAMDRAMLDAAEHVIRVADEQTLVNYVAALGGVKDDRASTLLWDLVSRRVATEQALIAITWRKNPSDLPRLSAALEGPARGEEQSREVASLPYALRNSYGEAALPYLETALRNSHYVWVRTNCARELMLAGRRSGFAFVAEAITENKAYKREMVEFVREQFPEVRGADEGKLLEFLKGR